MANLSEQKREKMLQILDALKAQHKDEETIIAINEIKNEINSKKYGLVWEQHEENVDIQMKTHVPVFTEVKDREINANPSDEKYNFILEGDNLHSLKLLNKALEGRVDVIYIDPPYNTGIKDFIYDDAFVDKLDGYRHSKWISFMFERLKEARNLLSPNGTIFISIDDNEEANLRLLCDEIFGEDKFVANISWQRTYSPRNDSHGLSSEVEHILVYSREMNWQPHKLSRTEKMNSLYKNPDGDEKLWTSSSLTAPSASSHQGMVYGIQHPFTGEIMYPTSGRCWALGQDQMFENMQKWAKYKYEVLDDNEKRAEICGVSLEKIEKDIPSIVLDESLEKAKEKAEKILKGVWPYFYFTNNGKGGIRRKTYLEDMSGRMPTNYWPFDEVGHTDGAKKELKNLFNGKIPFDTPKPTKLIKRVLEIASNKDSIILDFFAGSGTTAQAVIEMNNEDDGDRRFIICTNNENDICQEVTYPRIKTIITGKRKDDSSYSEGIPSNVKYFRTDFVSKESEDEFYSVEEQLSNHIKEMIELENGISIDNEKYIMILTDEEADELEKTPERIIKCERIYVSGEVLLTQKQENLFKDKDIITIPQYYFEDELMEVGEL